MKLIAKQHYADLRLAFETARHWPEPLIHYLMNTLLGWSMRPPSQPAARQFVRPKNEQESNKNDPVYTSKDATIIPSRHIQTNMERPPRGGLSCCS